MKNKKTFLIISLILLTSTIGCASRVNQLMDSWVGSHKADLIRSWGPPQQIHSDGAEGEILVYGGYVNLGQTPGKVTYDYLGNPQYTAPTQQGYQKTRMFYVNKDGLIYHWRWQGL